jgi:hypothetical protein
MDNFAQYQESYTLYADAVASFSRARERYIQESDEFMRDSVLQRFEYCVEMGRKLGKQYCIYQ